MWDGFEIKGTWIFSTCGFVGLWDGLRKIYEIFNILVGFVGQYKRQWECGMASEKYMKYFNILVGFVGQDKPQWECVHHYLPMKED